MKGRWLVVWLAVSLAVNVLLAVAWILRTRPPRPFTRVVSPRVVVTNVLRPIRTNVVFQPRILTWADIESDDYEVYVGNLRAIGCPEATVRDLIVADVNEMFARRRQAEVPNPAREWWRAEPSAELLAVAAARREALDGERRGLLENLLGRGWEFDPPSALAEFDAPPLDGEILGGLAPETRASVREIERRFATRRGARAEAGDDGTEAVAQVSRQREFQNELAKVMTPEQLEEYLLRYSPAATQLRQNLRGVEVSPDEFRELHRALEGFEAKSEALAGVPAALAAQRRLELEQQRSDAFERVLGAGRLAHFALNQDPVFQQTRTQAEQLGVSAEKLILLYQFNHAAQEERQRVLNDAALSAEEQDEELADLYRDRQSSLRLLLGDEAYEKLREKERQ